MDSKTKTLHITGLSEEMYWELKEWKNDLKAKDWKEFLSKLLKRYKGEVGR